MTKTERTCPRCGLVFASEKLDGLCPSCLLDSLFSESDLDDSKAFWEDDGEDAEGASTSSSTESTTPSRRFSHFELLEELGRGGMGIVYRARDIGTGRIVALKVLQAHHLEVPDLVTRFRSEVRAVTSLDHPHVLPVHEVGEYEGIPFFSMKLTTGGSLAQRVGDYLGKPTEIARLLAKVARGVSHAHERGILHRDLKPGNILLDAAGEPYVCDFGLAKWIEDDRNLTITSAVLGTPHYIAPEQATGQKGLTTAADIYSLGAIIYELLTARPPFVGQSIIETLRLASENTPERPSSLAQNIPKDLETICLKCLEREPASRYPSASALATDLENWIEGRPILARPVGAAEQLWRWARRNPLPAALIASIAMLLAATAMVATVSAVRIEESLYSALIAQAKAARTTGRSGQRSEALEALRRAAKIHPSDDVVNEAVAAMALADIKIDQSWKIGTSSRPPRAFNASLDHLVDEIEPGVLRILHLQGKEPIEVGRLSETNAPRIEFITHSGGDLIAVRHAGGLIKVWNTKTPKKLYNLSGFPTGAKATWYAFDCSFSPDGRKLALGSPSGGAVIFDVSTGAEMARLETSLVPGCLAFSPDGSQLALGSYKGSDLQIWDLSKRELKGTLSIPGPAYHIAWSPDGHMIGVGSSDMNAYVLDAGRGQLLGVCRGHRQEVTQVIFSRDNDRLITTGRDVTVRIWSLTASTQSGKAVDPPAFAQEVYLPAHGGEPSLRLSASGAQLGLLKGENACLASLDSGERVCRTLVNGRPPARATLMGSLAFSPNGERVATASWEYVDVWDVVAGRLLGSFDLDPDVEKSVRFGADEETLIVASPVSGLREFKIILENDRASLSEPRVIDAEKGFIFSNTPPGDRSLFAMTDFKRGIARIFDPHSNRDIFRIENIPYVWDIGLSPDQKLAALSFSTLGEIGRGDIQIWDIAARQKVAVLRSKKGSLARFSLDGRWLKYTDEDMLVDTQTWEASTTYNLPGGPPSYSSGNEWLAMRHDDKLRVIDARTYGVYFTVDPSPLLPCSNFRVAASPDGRHLAIQNPDNMLLIWNLDSVKKKLQALNLPWTPRSSPALR
jgi:WD40 repeat protein